LEVLRQVKTGEIPNLTWGEKFKGEWGQEGIDPNGTKLGREAAG